MYIYIYSKQQNEQINSMMIYFPVYVKYVCAGRSINNSHDCPTKCEVPPVG